MPNTYDDDDDIMLSALLKDAKAKKKQTESNIKRDKPRPHNLKIDDKVMMLETVKGKATTTYKQGVFTVVAVKGSMITAAKSGSVYKRDSSHFKKVETPKSVKPNLIDLTESDAEPDALEPDLNNVNLGDDSGSQEDEQGDVPPGQVHAAGKAEGDNEDNQNEEGGSQEPLVAVPPEVPPVVRASTRPKKQTDRYQATIQTTRKRKS